MEVKGDGLTLSEYQFAAFMYQMNAIEHSFMISDGNRQDNTSLFSDTVWQQQRPQAVEITTQQQPRLDEVTT